MYLELKSLDLWFWQVNTSFDKLVFYKILSMYQKIED